MTFPTAEDIELTCGENDPVFNGIFIQTGCECNGYNCKYCICDSYCNGELCKGYLKSICYIKKNKIKEQILSEHDIVERLKELIESAKEYPYDQIEMKIVIENLKSILENKK